MSKRILILFSDAGGGHRSAGEAIAEALKLRYGQDVETQMVDVLKDYTPFPFNRLAAWYPGAVRREAHAWRLIWHLTNGAWRSRAITNLTWPLIQRGLKRFVCEHPADLIVSVHHLSTVPVLRAYGPAQPPSAIVVTDLVSTHAWWYHPDVDLCVVPTEPARAQALRYGLAAGQVRVLGLPVSMGFSTPHGDKAGLRAQLGLGNERPVVLIAGGGDGIGPLGEIARAIDTSGLVCELAVVTGRNLALREGLQHERWNMPVHIFGFTTQMPALMQAADVLVTKAGPGTLCEAFDVGLPMLLYGHIPGQEDGNPPYVTEAGAGFSTPGPAQVVAALQRWIGPGADPQALARASESARRLARPQAAGDIADAIMALAS